MSLHEAGNDVCFYGIYFNEKEFLKPLLKSKDTRKKVSSAFVQVRLLSSNIQNKNQDNKSVNSATKLIRTNSTPYSINPTIHQMHGITESL